MGLTYFFRVEPHFTDAIRTTFFLAVWVDQTLPVNCDNLSMKSVQLSVVSKRELINSSFYERFFDVSEILIKVEINLLWKNNWIVAFVVQNNISDMQAQKVFARFKNIKF